MTTHIDHSSHDIGFEAMLGALWIGIPVFASAGFVFGLIIPQLM